MTTRVTRSRVSSSTTSNVITQSSRVGAEYKDFTSFDITTRPKLKRLSLIFKSLVKVISDDLVLDTCLEQNAVSFVMYLQPYDQFNLRSDDVLTNLVPSPDRPFQGFVDALNVLTMSRYESVVVAGLTLFNKLLRHTELPTKLLIVKCQPLAPFLQSDGLRSLPVIGHEQVHTGLLKVLRRLCHNHLRRQYYAQPPGFDAESDAEFREVFFGTVLERAEPYLRRIVSLWRMVTDEAGELAGFSSLLHSLVNIGTLHEGTLGLVLSLRVGVVVGSVLSERVTVYMNDKLFMKLGQTADLAVRTTKEVSTRWKEMVGMLWSEGLMDSLEEMLLQVKYFRWGVFQGVQRPRTMGLKFGCNFATIRRW
ncbi:hypothetical protein BLNAU_10175 [Blattamonas nauphoetae]|nr:hypothetical protein BLNAU_10175 [Blattamonas nauphoetae]